MKNTLLMSLVLSLFVSHAYAAPEKKAKVTKLTIETGTKKNKDENVFSKSKLTVKAGETVELKLITNATDVNMMHNWVLVKPGTADAVAMAAMPAGAEKGWFVKTPDVIAFTETLKGAPKPQTTTVTFTAPTEKGEYPYLCTFPGHNMSMKGVLVVN